MKKGKGGTPIAPLKPQRPARPKKRPPGTVAAPRRPASMAPPPAPRKKTGRLPAKRDSTGQRITEFFREKPEPEPPSGRISVEIDVDAEANNPPSIPSITVELDEPDFEPPATVRSPAGPGEQLQGFESILQNFSMVLKRLNPSAEGEFSFSENGIFVGREKIGKVEKTPAGIKMRVWMHKLGFSVDSLPASAIFGLFRIQDFFFADAKVRARFVSVYAESNESRDNIKLCFHKEEAEQAFLSAPLQMLRPAKKP